MRPNGSTTFVVMAGAAAALGGTPWGGRVAALGAQTVRDSAGIQIVESRTPALPQARGWRVDPQPRLTIGDPRDPSSADTVYEFSLMMGAAKMGDGGWAVALQAANAIRFFDERGRFVRAAGRYGRGPGELEQVLRLFRLPGDTLLVSDIGDAEYFAADGRWIRLGASRGQAAGNQIFPLAAFDDQSFAGIDFNDATERLPAGGARVFPLVIVSRDGAVRRTVGVVPGRPFVPGAAPMASAIAFAARPLLAGDGQRLHFAYGARFDVTTYARDGRVVRIVRKAHTPVAVTATLKAEYAAYRLRVAEAVRGGPLPASDRARFDQALGRTQYADELPAAGAMLVDRAGNLWVRRYDTRETVTIARVGRNEGLPSTPTPDFASAWEVFDTRGRWLCTVELPARFTPFDIGADYLAGLGRNEDDVELFQVFRLIKP